MQAAGRGDRLFVVLDVEALRSVSGDVVSGSFGNSAPMLRSLAKGHVILIQAHYLVKHHMASASALSIYVTLGPSDGATP